jgi:hypothetical protein
MNDDTMNAVIRRVLEAFCDDPDDFCEDGPTLEKFRTDDLPEGDEMSGLDRLGFAPLP